MTDSMDSLHVPPTQRLRQPTPPVHPVAPDTESSPAREASNAPDAAHLVIRRGPQVGKRLPLRPGVTKIGRHRECEIVLDEASVSRRHAEIRHDTTHDSFTLVDTGSLNGTYLNRFPIDQAELNDGDEVWVGIFRMIFHASGGAAS